MKIFRSIEVYERNSENDFLVEQHILNDLNIESIRQYFNIRFIDEDTGFEEFDYNMVFDYEIDQHLEPIFTKLYPYLNFNFEKYQYFFSSYV